MDAQELRNFHEAYMEVYGEGRVAWNDKKNPNPSGYTPKEKAKAKVKQLIGDLDKTPSDKDYQRAGNISSTSDEQDRRREKPTHKYEKLGKKVLIGQDRNQTRGQSTRAARKKIGHKYAINQVPKEKQKYYPTEQIDIYDIILSHLLDEGYAETEEAASAIMVNMSEEWRESIVIAEGMTMKDFKANRKKAKASATRADAVKRGHVGKEWYNSGRRYSPDEAKRMRSNLDDEERRTRHRSAVDPDSENDDAFSADKTKNPKKIRKQKAMGELG